MTAATRWRVAIAIALAVLLAVLLWGGYVASWSWTGLSGEVALWDWLEALALPVAVGLLPLVLRHRQRLTRTHRAWILVGLVAFAVLVVAAYVVPLEWTGFPGNTLWDWLELALLPVVLVTAPLWPHPRELRTGHWLVLGTAAVVFAVVVLAGYLVPWEWTGFSDNKAWDWVKLLLLPVLVPTVLLPALERLLDDDPVQPA